VKFLPTPMAIADLGRFTAELRLLHHGSSTPLSAVYMILCDENRELAFFLGVVDEWTGHSEQYSPLSIHLLIMPFFWSTTIKITTATPPIAITMTVIIGSSPSAGGVDVAVVEVSVVVTVVVVVVVVVDCSVI
jgi:hypothetical protein